MPRYFQYYEGPTQDNPHNETLITISDEEILEKYWDFWLLQMLSTGQVESLWTPENCIQDFITIHWAEEVTHEEGHG